MEEMAIDCTTAAADSFALLNAVRIGYNIQGRSLAEGNKAFYNRWHLLFCVLDL